MSTTTPETSLEVRDVVEPVYRAKFWMQLIGVMLILSGIVTALSIVGIIVAWIPIWGGVVLMQAASAVNRAYNENSSREAVYSMSRLKIYFTIFGVLMLIYAIIFVLMTIFGVGAGIMGME